MEKQKKYMPFIEKYRPNDIDHIILPISIKRKVINIIESRNIPNMIITGEPGTGKTSTILLIAKKILGKNYKDSVLELNASYNRTLDYINTTVTYFCKKKLCDDTIIHNLIIFDEADNITKKAQTLLANLIEENKNTRFVFTCNESSKIIESIQSNCMILKYNSLNHNDIKEKLEYICKKENIIYEESGINAIIQISNGDVRKALNNLEVTYNGYNIITDKNVYKICYLPYPDIIVDIIISCVNTNLINAINKICNLKKSGFCSNDILLSLLNNLKSINIDEDIRINFINIISEYYMYITDGIESNLQLYSCISKLIQYINNTNIK